MSRVFGGPRNQAVAFVDATIEVEIALGSAQLVQAQLMGGADDHNVEPHGSNRMGGPANISAK